MNVIGYTRLSRAGNGHGLTAQRQAIEEHCRRQGWTLLAIETDEAASGRSTRKRPGLAAAIEKCRAGESKAIVASRVDRLARSSLDFARLIEQANRHGFNLICVEQGFDLRTPEGKLLANILAGFAEFEADLISARTKAGLEVARSKGRRGGNPNLVRVDEKTRARIRELRASGLSLSAIARQLEAEKIPTVGGGPWRVDVLSRLLSREAADPRK